MQSHSEACITRNIEEMLYTFIPAHIELFYATVELITNVCGLVVDIRWASSIGAACGIFAAQYDVYTICSCVLRGQSSPDVPCELGLHKSHIC